MVFQIIFSIIVLASAKPTDINEPYEDASANVSVSAEDDEKSSISTGDESTEYIVSETFQLPPDEIRIIRRNVQTSASNSTEESEQKTDEPAKVPLRRLITAVEADLVTQALQINGQLRRRRSTPQLSNGDSSRGNSTSSNDSGDANKNLFEGLFNFTRPLRETEEKNVKIQLNGLVQAVESTLIHSAQNLKEPKKLSQDEASIEATTELNESLRINRDTNSQNDEHDAPDSKKEPVIQVQKLDSANPQQSLNILNPITFKPVAPVTETTTACDETPATTEYPIVQKTNVTVIHATNTVSLIPATDKKPAHVQHQEISKTVFHSNLAIFPTLAPKAINAPLPHTTTAVGLTETTVAAQASNAPNKSEKDAKYDELLQKTEKLKEKFAEIQAEPIIFSQL